MALINLHPVRRGVAVVALGVMSLAIAAASPQTGCSPETFSALAVNRSDEALLLSSQVDINIRRWSSEREKTRFARTLLNDGAKALLLALQRGDAVGDIRTQYTLPSEIRFAWQEPLEGDGRRIVLITDRAVSIWKEAMHLQDSRDTFTVIELRIPDAADGEGKVAIGSNVHANRSLDLIELEDYAAAPVRLIGVRTRRATTTAANGNGGGPCLALRVFSVR